MTFPTGDAAERFAITAAGVPPVSAGSGRWISRLLSLPEKQRTGWVVAQAMHEYHREASVAQATGRRTFADRMASAGLGRLVSDRLPPRQAIAALATAAGDLSLLGDAGQRSMLAAIGRSLPSYIAGVRCWAAFAGAPGRRATFSRERS